MVFDRHRPEQPGIERDALDHARTAARTYRTMQQYGRNVEPRWDEVIEALDGYLQLIQEQHLREVEEADASGR